jgi:hypothetical protein
MLMLNWEDWAVKKPEARLDDFPPALRPTGYMTARVGESPFYGCLGRGGAATFRRSS